MNIFSKLILGYRLPFPCFPSIRENRLNSWPNLDEAARCAMKQCKAPWSMPAAYEALRSNISGGIKIMFQQGGDNSLNSWPNLDEAARCSMKRCKAPWSMPAAYEALRSNICGGVKIFVQRETACTPVKRTLLFFALNFRWGHWGHRGHWRRESKTF